MPRRTDAHNELPAKIPGAITTNNLRTEVNRERWDEATYRVVIRNDAGKEIPVTGIANDRDRLVLTAEFE